jgi:hypothetical protein
MEDMVLILIDGDPIKAVEAMNKVRDQEGQNVVDAYLLGMLRGAAKELRRLSNEVRELREQASVDSSGLN